jgi:hypothetical protein
MQNAFNFHEALNSKYLKSEDTSLLGYDSTGIVKISEELAASFSNVQALFLEYLDPEAGRRKLLQNITIYQ